MNFPHNLHQLRKLLKKGLMSRTLRAKGSVPHHRKVKKLKYIRC